MYGIDYLRKDGQGYIYWKDRFVEHLSYHGSQQAEEKADCERIAKRCRKLEAWKFPVNSLTVAWAWSWFQDWETLPAAERELYHHFFAQCTSWFENAQGDLAFVLSGDTQMTGTCVITTWKKEICSFSTEQFAVNLSHGSYHVLIDLNFKIADMNQGENSGTIYATTADIAGFIKRHRLDECFFVALENLLNKRQS